MMVFNCMNLGTELFMRYIAGAMPCSFLVIRLYFYWWFDLFNSPSQRSKPPARGYLRFVVRLKGKPCQRDKKDSGGMGYALRGTEKHLFQTQFEKKYASCQPGEHTWAGNTRARNLACGVP